MKFMKRLKSVKPDDTRVSGDPGVGSRDREAEIDERVPRILSWICARLIVDAELKY